MWAKLSPILGSLKYNVSPNDIRLLLDENNESTFNDINNNNSFTTSCITKKLISSTQIFKSNNEIQSLTNVLVSLKWVEEELAMINTSIEQKLPFPDDLQNNEYNCCVFVNTLLYDKWYESGETTGNRSEFAHYAFLIWKLSLGYRLWSRYSLIFPEEGETNKSFIWGKTSVFRYDNLFQVPQGLDDLEIFYWSPERVYIAMEYISSSYNKNGLMSLKSNNTSLIFISYRQALIDRLSVISHYDQIGPIEVLTTTYPNWFSFIRTNITHDGKSPFETSNPYSLIQKELLDMKKAQDSDMSQMYGNTITSLNPNDKYVKVEQVADIIEKLKVNDDLEIANEKLMESIKEIKLLIGIFKDENLSSFKTNTSSSEYPDDEEELKTHERKLKDLYLQIEENKKKIDGKSEKIIIDRNMSNVNAMRQLYRKANVKKYMDKYRCKIDWFKDNMILANHICQIHIQERNIIDLNDKKRQMFNKDIYNSILSSIQITNTDEFMCDAEKWISQRFVTVWEREKFRNRHSSKKVFTNLDAVLLCREESGEECNIGVGSSNISELLNKDHPLYYRTIAYVTYWWLSQSYNTLNLDSSIFIWDIEYEYSSLTRRHLSSPSICKLGNTWAVFLGGEWEDQEKRYINCRWCGPNLIDALVEYTRIISLDNWKIFCRNTGTCYSLHETVLYNFNFDLENINN